MKRFIKGSLKILLSLFVLVNIIVAFHAYKFTYFYDTGTITVKPNEQKSTWDVTKEMLFGINAQKQTNEKPDTAYETVKLTTKDKIELYAWYTATPNAKGTVCMFHGHGGKKSGNNGEAAAFRSLGYNTLQVDFRAHGDSKGNTCTIGFLEAEDVKLAYDYIKNKGEKNIVLWGISMGGAAVIKSLHDYADIQPNKVIIEMPFGTMLDAAEGRIKMMGLPAEPLAGLITFWGGTEHGFWAFGYKPQEYAKKINYPTLLQWGANDPRVTRKEEETIFANLATTNKKFVVYENSQHESLCKNEHTKWMTEVENFLK